MTVRAVLFDAYGTLFDVYSVGLLAEQLFPAKGDALARLWRDKQIEYSRITSMSGRYRPFWELTRAGLRYSAAALGLALDRSAEDRLMNQYGHLSAFPEVQPALAAVKERGLPTGILSNGDPAMLEVAVKSAGIASLLDHLISVDQIKRYKTDPAAYELGIKVLGLDAKDVLFVSSNAWDAIGATWFGYTTLWVNRTGLPLDPLDTTPSFTASSLAAVLGCIAA